MDVSRRREPSQEDPKKGCPVFATVRPSIFRFVTGVVRTNFPQAGPGITVVSGSVLNGVHAGNSNLEVAFICARVCVKRHAVRDAYANVQELPTLLYRPSHGPCRVVLDDLRAKYVNSRVGRQPFLPVAGRPGK